MKTVSTAVVLAAAAVSLTALCDRILTQSRGRESRLLQYAISRCLYLISSEHSTTAPASKRHFPDGEDRLGSQAKTILVTHLQQTNRFNVLNRTNLNALKQESGISAKRIT